MAVKEVPTLLPTCPLLPLSQLLSPLGTASPAVPCGAPEEKPTSSSSLVLKFFLYVNSGYRGMLHLNNAFARTFANETHHCRVLEGPSDLVVFLCHLECVRQFTIHIAAETRHDVSLSEIM